MFVRQVSGICGLTQNIGRNISPAASASHPRWISKSSEVDTLAKGQQQDQATSSSATNKLHKGNTLKHKKNFRFVEMMIICFRQCSVQMIASGMGYL